MAMTTAYWINWDAQMLEIPAIKHITAVVEQPEKFGLTKGYIEKKYAEYDEPVGLEGRARDDIIRIIVGMGFIRVRLYRTHWSVTVHEINAITEAALGGWADVAKDNKQAGKYMDVKILELATNAIHDYTVEGIYNEFYDADDEFVQVESLSEFSIPQINITNELTG